MGFGFLGFSGFRFWVLGFGFRVSGLGQTVRAVLRAGWGDEGGGGGESLVEAVSPGTWRPEFCGHRPFFSAVTLRTGSPARQSDWGLGRSGAQVLATDSVVGGWLLRGPVGRALRAGGLPGSRALPANGSHGALGQRYCDHHRSVR